MPRKPRRRHRLDEANIKNGPFLRHCAEAVFDFRSRANESLPNIDDSYTWAPTLCIFVLGVWLAVPGESTATMDRLKIPLHEQDRVNCTVCKTNDFAIIFARRLMKS